MFRRNLLGVPDPPPLSCLPRWLRNQTQSPSIHGVVHCLTEWLSRVPLQEQEAEDLIEISRD